MNLRSIYHININCTDFERAYAFYQMLGFRPIVGPGEGAAGTISDRILHLGPKLARACFYSKNCRAV